MKNEVAERYGAGLFELAKEENKVEEYMNQKKILNYLLSSSLLKSQKKKKEM